MSTNVLIIVLNYRNDEDTLLCLKSLKAHIPPETADICLIENSDIPTGVGKEYATYYEAIENRGYSHGNNVGLRLARDKGYPYALLLNNDTLCDHDFLSGMLRVMKEQGFGAASPKLIMADVVHTTPKGLPKLAYAGAFEPSSRLAHWYPRGVFNDEIDVSEYSKNERCDWLTGACLLLSIQALDTVGYLDEDYFLYYEDVDWSLRALSKAIPLGYIGTEYVYHQHSKSTSSVKAFYYPRAFLLFIRKHRPQLFSKAVGRFFWHYVFPHSKKAEFRALLNDFLILSSVFKYVFTQSMRP